MSGFNFSAAPSTVPATTIFLGGGPVPERLTMLLPYHIDLSNGFVNDRIISGLMMNTWTSWDRSFYSGTAGASTVLGAFTTAPDGTNTAQHVAATIFNDVHFMSAGLGFPTGGSGGPAAGGLLVRVVFIAKTAELSRCMMIVDDMQGLSLGNQQGNSDGFKCVFDLAGGQIGVANTAIGPNGSVAGPAQIVPIGSGFYQCWMEGQINFGSGTTGTNGIRVSIYLDNGSGTGAQSTSFAGDGTSGIYIWKCSCLPPLAWSLTGTTFFDDFTSTSTIDLANTQAPGFNWYINNSWVNGHNFNAIPATNPGTQLSQSGSILTILGAAPITGLILQSATNKSLGTFFGTTFQPPGLFECRCAYDVSLIGGSTYNGTPTFWTNAAEALSTTDPPPNSIPYSEYDFFEGHAGGASEAIPHTSAFQGSESGDNTFNGNTQNSSTANYTKWYPNHALWNSLTTGIFDSVDGNIYSCNNNGPSLTNPPHSNPTDWTLTGAPIANAVIGDYAAQNLYSSLWLPFNTPNGPLPLNMGGTTIQFFNNICVPFGVMRYGPSMLNIQSNNPYFQTGDKYHYVLNLATAINAHMSIDYVKVTQ